jgi:hypothetical protein
MKQMKLINKTKWNTADLKKLCMAVIKHKGSHKNHQITVKTGKYRYSNSDRIGGLARLFGTTISMKVPLTTKPNNTGMVGNDGKTIYEQIPNALDVGDFAKILDHEIDHNLGLRHKVMQNWRKLDVGYLNGFKVGIQEVKEKPKIDLLAKRHLNAILKIKKLESEIKRKQNLLKKWEKKDNYYNKKRSIIK